MRTRFAGLALLIGASPLAAQAPNTDVFVATLGSSSGQLEVMHVVNATHRPGYDNQPAFTADGRAVLFTAQSDGQTDIWRYTIADGALARVTSTPESEYSATMMPGGKRFSVIRVERDSAQRLWSFALDGSDPQLLLPNLKPVGYHDWLGVDSLALYVLGTPSTLHVVTAGGSRDTVLTRDIGRAIHKVPGRASFTYTQREAGRLWIYEQPIAGGAPARLLYALADNEFHAWTPTGELLSATGSSIVRMVRLGDGTYSWSPVADLSQFGVKNISRLAVSPDGRTLAFVGEPASP